MSRKYLSILALTFVFQSHAFAADTSSETQIYDLDQKLANCDTFDYACANRLMKQKIKLEEKVVSMKLQQIKSTVAQIDSPSEAKKANEDLKAFEVYFDRAKQSTESNVQDLKNAFILESYRTYKTLSEYSGAMSYLSGTLDKMSIDLNSSGTFASE